MNGEEKVKQVLGVGSAGGGDHDIGFRLVNTKFSVPDIAKAVAAHFDLVKPGSQAKDRFYIFFFFVWFPKLRMVFTFLCM